MWTALTKDMKKINIRTELNMHNHDIMEVKQCVV